ncbi:MAG: EAL domain-containing protein [Candidatus Thiodiazotropha sp. (ex Monitilora ramsayi)]|nr:EAL domain-containing protein [Candidatus Thiodiazotropha sp. (ex Monitilora ramsayi)]
MANPTTPETNTDLQSGFTSALGSLRKYTLIALIAWTLLITGAFTWTMHDQGNREFATALGVARAYFLKDQAVRQWGATQGGVYVKVSDHTQPNPHLEELPNRDVTTDAGQDLTLMNPAYMIRQINERFSRMHNDYIHITSLDPLHDENEPDEWERAVLKTFKRESDEVAEIVAFRNQPSLRMMRPMVTKQRCLKCHERHGYEVGDIRGGVSIAIPMAPYRKDSAEQLLLIGTTHGGIWLCGMLGIGFYTRRAHRHLEDRQQAIHSLARAGNYNRSVISALGEGLLGFDGKGRLTFLNPAAEQLLGWKEHELQGKSVHGFIHYLKMDGSPCQEDECPMLGVLQSGESHASRDDQFMNRERSPLPVSYIATPLFDQRRVVGGVVAFQDITEQKQSLQRIEYLAHHDSLTGLPNRVAFLEAVDNALAHARRYEHGLALLFLDLDNFGVINDSAGHTTGDELLTQVAKRLRNEVRQPDIVARQGGDEFLILMFPDGKEDDSEDPAGHLALKATTLARRVLDTMHAPFLVDGKNYYIKTSIGISLFPEDARDRVEMLKNADAAMYTAKGDGRDTYALFAGDLAERIQHRHMLETGLNQALIKEEFHLLYQPIVDLSDGRILAVEALLRLNSATLGNVSPKELIPVAEECGLILPIGRWVLQTACRQMAKWHEKGLNLRIAVNLSTLQLQRDDLESTVLQALEDAQIPASALALEITEGATLHASPDVIDMLKRLHNLGIGLSLDDFGTGYSSLSRLKNLPVDTLKIDKSFVDGVATKRDDEQIVITTIELAKNLNKRALAEGIESREQWQCLVRNGCHRGQGYFFSRPVNATAIEDLVREGGHWNRSSIT